MTNRYTRRLKLKRNTAVRTATRPRPVPTYDSLKDLFQQTKNVESVSDFSSVHSQWMGLQGSACCVEMIQQFESAGKNPTFTPKDSIVRGKTFRSQVSSLFKLQRYGIFTYDMSLTYERKQYWDEADDAEVDMVLYPHVQVLMKKGSETKAFLDLLFRDPQLGVLACVARDKTSADLEKVDGSGLFIRSFKRVAPTETELLKARWRLVDFIDPEKAASHYHHFSLYQEDMPMDIVLLVHLDRDGDLVDILERYAKKANLPRIPVQLPRFCSCDECKKTLTLSQPDTTVAGMFKHNDEQEIRLREPYINQMYKIPLSNGKMSYLRICKTEFDASPTVSYGTDLKKLDKCNVTGHNVSKMVVHVEIDQGFLFHETGHAPTWTSRYRAEIMLTKPITNRVETSFAGSLIFKIQLDGDDVAYFCLVEGHEMALYGTDLRNLEDFKLRKVWLHHDGRLSLIESQHSQLEMALRDPADPAVWGVWEVEHEVERLEVSGLGTVGRRSGSRRQC